MEKERKNKERITEWEGMEREERVRGGMKSRGDTEKNEEKGIKKKRRK